ncbi:hypothetical protein DN407_31470 (plasmid) [Bacillus sp. JAS24-2]|uniref:ETX/MTX2 family pore-forming toxin n=1 Tax=Bacillus sp. JAS24-2 TaxID=2217832 RepID=UPI0011ED9B6B|nr:ETX/MTX2 family pore-forming toxin [Bacillus sp. JAS24-2]QEL82908.1 hypothetical protein DN407_31470 [Bacillus sp. JAS24-2]
MNKKLIISGMVVSILLGGTINSVYADQIQSNENLQYKNFGQQGALQDIDKTLDQIVDSINKNSPFISQIGLATNGTVNYTGINIKETNVTNILPLYLGSNTFSNETNEDQTYNTSIFSQAITNTTSTSIQNGFKTGLKVSGSAGIPFVAEGKVEASLEYNFSHTGTNTKSETNTITAPSQPVKVPKGKIYKTEVYFEKKSTSGNVDLFADVNQGVRGYRINPVVSKLSHFLDRAGDKYGAIQSPNDPDSIRLKGSGSFKIEYGTNLIVKTYDITSKPELQFRSLTNSESESTKLVNTKIIPLKPSN